ncbi:hypothetical protein IQ258_02660 [Coleofasciculus sp. LEGE 07081]|uniref:interleukin-like EMT inducer domain-containing protein n=1 Tax=Coleofasciculus sp. LEGE 07081 TaxID=2777967 RepID=UPI0018805581|nr:interleukin-like EMT inducer domain-containing protein [Coleofasciculus sp. LEGE 07081]MBE9125085.1 hypothetical protein [Coleofasciculus sp. LEGE 07081]
MKVQSAGYNHGNSALITVNDEEFGFESYSQGLNVALIHEVTGQKLCCTTFDTYGDEGSATAFAQFIENLPNGRIVALSVKDDASLRLNDRAKKACESLGSYLSYFLQFRSSWTMISQKNALPGTPEESLSYEAAVTCSRSFVVPSVSANGSTISVTSAGLDFGDVAQITLNGQGVAIEGGYQRGLNVVVFDSSTTIPILNQSFDLFANPTAADAFAQLIEDLPEGQIVAIAVKDDGFYNLSERAKQACEAIGSRLIHHLQFRNSWAIVGYKGASPGSIIENLNTSGAVSVKFWISSLISMNGKWQQKQKLQPSDLQSKDIFGSAIALSEKIAIIGARMAEVEGHPAAGSAYIFELENGQWQQKQRLHPPGLQRQDVFGNSVAISGDVAIVGAYFADAEGRPDAGSAYIFHLENGQWHPKQKLQPSDLQQGDYFGNSVAISGELAIVGAYGVDSEGRPNVGSAYIFQLENGQWHPKQKLQPADLQGGDCFGTSVAISGKVAIVGARLAHGESSQYAGSAYIFQLENGQWHPKQKLQPADLQQSDNFGNSVAISGEVAIVGAYGVDFEGYRDAGSAYIFQLENGQWHPKQKLQPADLQRGGGFGTSVAISSQVAIIGASGLDAEGRPDAGSAYIFHLENGEWQQKEKLQPADLEHNNCFGYAVAISETVAIVGAHNAHAEGSPYAGSAYIFATLP